VLKTASPQALASTPYSYQNTSSNARRTICRAQQTQVRERIFSKDVIDGDWFSQKSLCIASRLEPLNAFQTEHITIQYES